jgi:cobalt-zinc-cadmium efflux system outer membrane protein
MRRISLFLAVRAAALLVAFPFLLTAQEVQERSVPTRLTLESATEILLLSNPTILRERQNIAIARADVISARLRPNPQFGLNSESYPLFEANPGPFFQRQELILRIGQPIETAGKRRKRTRVAEQEVEVAGTFLQDTIRQLKLELGQRYYSAVLAKANLELAREVLNQFDEIIRLNEARYRQGEISGLDLNRVQTERLRFLNDVLDAELQLRNAKTALLELLGAADLSADIEVAEPLQFQPLKGELEELQSQALAARADLVAQRGLLERDRRQRSVEEALAAPNITPFFGYKRNEIFNTVVFGVDVPLPFFNRNQGGIARASARISQRQSEIERVRLQVQSEVQQAYQTVQSQEERVRVLDASYVPSARRARDIAQTSYRLGALDLIAFLDAERAYRETLRSYNRTLFDHQVAVFQLQAAVGKEF